ncbi:MAG: CoA transferase [Lachnospiraceae bacterium]|jgi:crotonobetainyl-CoA:carnitine CoA-transferase CaiB-like acyl-CoA transferase|nr:CoA transferase [Lachnospiraceae bacterium]
MEGILKGIRILDLGRFISAPFCGMLLADMGAEVIKIERVGAGEDGRRLGPYKDGISVYVTAFNRNKKGITLNFRTDEGKEIFRKLIEKSDVIIENFRPGTMAKMGFDYETCKAINPRIIMSSISGFGQEGRYSHKAAFDGIAAAMSGMYAINFTESGPRPTGIPLGDHISGIYNALAIMMALYDRERTGQGQLIDTAMVDCLFSVFETRLPGFALNGVDIGVVPKYGTGDPLACPSNVYRCKDGYVCLHAGTDPNYKRFAEVTEDEGLMQEKYLKIEERMADYFTVDKMTADWFAGQTVEDADRLLTEAGVPCGIVFNLKRILEDPNSKEREMVVYTEVPGLGAVPFVGNPLKLKTRPIENRERAPLIGEHTDEILKTLAGIREEELAAFREKGVI